MQLYNQREGEPQRMNLSGSDTNERMKNICSITSSGQCQNLTQKTTTIKTLTAFSEKIMHDYSPLLCQEYTSKYLDRCFSGTAPTLTRLRLASPGTEKTWLEAQISYLNTFCGTEKKMDNLQIDTISNAFVNSYGYIKLTELMVFFANIASGKFGKFYGAVDPMQIMTNFCEFMKYRSVMLDKIESERRSEERNKMLSNPKCITREQYEAQKKQNAK